MRGNGDRFRLGGTRKHPFPFRLALFCGCDPSIIALWDSLAIATRSNTGATSGKPTSGWTSFSWFLARPVDAALVTSKSWAEAQFEGREYKLQSPQSFTSQRAAGFVANPFRWREMVSISDFVSDRFVIARECPGREFRWVGEVLEPRELLTALAMSELPAAYRNSAGVTPPTLVAAPNVTTTSPKRPSQALRLAGVLLTVVAIFAAIGTAAYQYERFTKPIAAKWFACEAKPAQAHVVVPPEASSLHLDPHLPQGAVDYQLKILNAQGAVLESHKDFLDMNPKRHTLKLSLPAGAAAVEATCTVHYGIAGVPSWPIELRFFH